MKVILTCTTTANRLDIFYYGIQSLLNQSIKPDKFVVNLAREEFEPKGKHKVPKWLIDNRIIIQLTKDTGPYKKLIPSFQFADDDDIIVTADDDTIYHEMWLENLVQASKANPDYIICSIARKLKKNIFNNWRNYGSWPICNYETSSLFIIPIGAGGVAYKKRLLDMDFLIGLDFMEIAPGTDDLWFKMASMRKQVEVKVIPSYSLENMAIQHNKGLVEINVRKRKGKAFFRLFDYLWTGIRNYFGVNLTRNDKNWDSIIRVSNK